MTGNPAPVSESGGPGEHHFKIAGRAETFLKAAAAGNGIEAAQMRLVRHDTAVYPLQGVVTAAVKPLLVKTQKKGNMPQGEVLDSAPLALARVEAMALEVAAMPEVQEHIVRAINKDAGEGWEIPAQKIPLNATRPDVCIVEKCLKCSGQGGFPCMPCNATGRGECQGCAGQGQTGCISCHGTGQYQRGDGEQVACTRCHAQGHIICAICGGQKSIHCKICNGTGRAQCGECAGSGWWTTVYSASYVAEVSFALDRKTADPAALALAEKIGLRALAVDSHAEILRAPPQVAGAVMTTPLTALFPVAEAEFAAGGKALPAQVAGLNGRVMRLEPFLDAHINPALDALARVAQGGIATGALLGTACKVRLVKDVLSRLPAQGKKKTYQALLREYGLAVSDKYARLAVARAAEALAALSRGPRLRGLAVGTALAAALAAAWYMTPARSLVLDLLQRRDLARHILACDIAAWLVGWGGAVLVIKAMATHAVGRFLPPGEKPPVQAAGDEGLYALFAAFVLWLAVAAAAHVRPEWLALLLAKIGI